MNFKKTLKFLICFALIVNLAPNANAVDAYADGKTDAMSFWFDPDLTPGETSLSYFAKKQYRYLYKEAKILDSSNSTYFMITGASGYPNYPDFYGGVQQLYDGKRVAIFSAWDLGVSNCEYFSCQSEDAEQGNKISLWAKGPRTTSQRGGGEGTFMQSYIYDLDWKIGQKISWLVSLEPSGTQSLLSVAIKLEGEPWELFASYVIPARFKNGLPGGYGFIEDYGVNTPFVPRSMSLGPTIAETSDGKMDALTNLYVGSSKDKNRHKVSVVGSAAIGQVGTEPQLDAKQDYKLRLGAPVIIPDFIEGKALLDEIVKGKSTRLEEQSKRLEEEAAFRIKAEAEAKAEQLKALQKKNEKVTSAKKLTIFCVKGIKVKKVTSIKPMCPSGYKKR